uniref:Uncharacterized protein n=1 Tax=Lactuca sativa TaxID=4236 RepID=A0A9R1VZH9_LACSA|nr:hypothetical protein LSAT_V11C300106760 [Lactuca sativa]
MWGLRNVGENVNVQEVYGYNGTEIMYYHFRLPNEGFDFGLRALGLICGPYSPEPQTLATITVFGTRSTLGELGRADIHSGGRGGLGSRVGGTF